MRFTRGAAIAAAALVLAACSSDDGTPDLSASAPEVSASASAEPASLDPDLTPDESLSEAVRTSDVALAQLALDAGADPGLVDEDAGNNTPLSIAITRNDPAMVQLLVDAGAPVEYPEFGWTELVTAGEFAGGEVVSILLGTGADPNGFPMTETNPLFTAAYNGNVSAAEALLEAGADVTVGATFGDVQYPPLFGAAYGNEPDTVDLLLQWGADPAWTNEDGERAGDWAISQGNAELGAYLNGLAEG